jgi:hypothetical protein
VPTATEPQLKRKVTPKKAITVEPPTKTPKKKNQQSPRQSLQHDCFWDGNVYSDEATRFLAMEAELKSVRSERDRLLGMNQQLQKQVDFCQTIILNINSK